MSKSTNNFFEKKKDWSITKDSILGSYLTPYFLKMLAYRKPICYVDCFAGKGKFDDGANGSPLIAFECIEKDLQSTNTLNAKINGYFIELNHHEALKANLPKSQSTNFKAMVIAGRFEDHIDSILRKHSEDTVFLYIDPYGIKALDVDKFCSFKSNSSKSVEMLINFNTWGFFREACNVLKVDFKLDKKTESYLVEYEPSNDINREELTMIAGGDFWIQIVQDFKNKQIDSKKAEQMLALGIANAFRKKYKYVLNVPVKSNPNNKTPKYRLFHLTNHEDGCLLMADIMHKRIKESIERQQGGQLSLFEFNTEGDIEMPLDTKAMIKDSLGENDIHLHTFLCQFFTKYGIETGSSKLKEYIKELETEEFLRIIRFPSKSSKGKPTSFMKEEKDKKVILRKVAD